MNTWPHPRNGQRKEISCLQPAGTRESKVASELPAGSWISAWLLTQLASDGEKKEHLLCTTGEQRGLLMGVFKLQAMVEVELYPPKKRYVQVLTSAICECHLIWK